MTARIKTTAGDGRSEMREPGKFVAHRARSLRGGSLLRRLVCSERALIFGLAAALSCASPPPAPPPVDVVAGVIDERWKVFDDSGAVLGYVARTRYAFASGERLRFIVENAYFQDVGFIDENGRAYRPVPHADEPQFVGTGSLEDGLGRLFRAKGAVHIEPLPASFHPSLDRE
jgi:hypothetical protein